ncbi:hypothetical protein BHE74_00051976 [Ensete ventricosum]|nr:hypothetical protein BHE74_00051976 [Ensete ventricosum]
MFLQSYSPLVGNKAPDFEAEAVFDQEFINVSLCLITLLHLREPLRYEFAFSLWCTILHRVLCVALCNTVLMVGYQHLFFTQKLQPPALFKQLFCVVLQALQYVQENPDEVCPAGWKPGEKSMKPDPKLSKEYFAAVLP